MSTRAIAAAALAAAALASPAASAAPRSCAEDAPCWTWPTMGNLERGVYLRGHVHRVRVDASCFAQLYPRIDWRRTPHLRGDWTAYVHGENIARFAHTLTCPLPQ